MELAGEPSALELLRLDDPLQRIAREPLGEVDAERGAGREGLGETKVGFREAHVRAELVMGGQDSDRRVADDQRYVEARAGPDQPRRLGVDVPIVRHRVDALAAPSGEDAAALRRGALDPLAEERLPTLAGDRREPQPPRAGREDDGHEACPEQLAQAPNDKVEQALEVRLGGERVPDLVQRLELARPVDRGLVQARVLDRDRGLRREQGHELLVLVRELLVPLLLRQVQVPVGDTAQQDRHAEERPHRRMAGREAHRARILRQVPEAERHCVPDQDAEDALTVGLLADGRAQLGADPGGQKAFEPGAGGVDHAERRILRVRQLGRGLHDPLKDPLERQLGCDRHADLDERAEPALDRGGRVHTVKSRRARRPWRKGGRSAMLRP